MGPTVTRSDHGREGDMEGRREFYIVTAVLLILLLVVIFWPG